MFEDENCEENQENQEESEEEDSKENSEEDADEDDESEDPNEDKENEEVENIIGDLNVINQNTIKKTLRKKNKLNSEGALSALVKSKKIKSWKKLIIFI